MSIHRAVASGAKRVARKKARPAPRDEDLLRAAIISEMQRRELTPYALSQMCDGTPSRNHLHKFLAGHTLSDPLCSRVLVALGMRVIRPG